MTTQSNTMRIVCVLRRLFGGTASTEIRPKRCDGDWLLRVSGEHDYNRDGTSRQWIIAHCEAGEPIQLVREPDNGYDATAIRICRRSGEQIGYVPADRAVRLAADMDVGVSFGAEIYDIGCDDGERPNREVTLRVWRLIA